MFALATPSILLVHANSAMYLLIEDRTSLLLTTQSYKRCCAAKLQGMLTVAALQPIYSPTAAVSPAVDPSRVVFQLPHVSSIKIVI